MLRFRNFFYLYESAESAQNTAGVLHELIVGQYLNGRKHMDHHPDKDGKTPQQAHDELKATLTPNEYDAIHHRAKAAAEDILRHVGQHGDVHSVHWTSKPGDLHRSTGIHASQSEDASDLVLTTKNDSGEIKHHGVSLKVSKNKPSTHIPLTNRGLEATYGGDQLAQAHKDKIYSMHPELKNLPNDPNEVKNDAASKRKRWAAANPQHAANIKKLNGQALNGIAQHLSDHLNREGPDAVVEHLRNHVLYAKKTPMQEQGHSHIRHTTYGDGSTEHYDPSEKFEHILQDKHNISVERKGTGVVFSHNGKPFARHTLKFNSQSDPVSTIKGIGNTTGSKKKAG